MISRKFVCPEDRQEFFYEKSYNLHRELRHDEYKAPEIVEEKSAESGVLK
jgi:hypothetical protein